MTDIPEILLQKAEELEERTAKLYPDLKPLVKQCFLNTIETTVKRLEDGSIFVITGDIPAMWLRDSAAQVKPYVAFAREDENLREILRGVIEKQAFYVCMDPYANAFNAADSGKAFGHQDKSDVMSGWVWERKYEVDSLCAPLYLAWEYYKTTGDRKIFTPRFHQMVKEIAETFTAQQNRSDAPYFFTRTNCPDSDTLPFDGRGTPVGYTGMTWSGFRPSDDACQYGYLIPANMMAVVTLRYASELVSCGFEDDALSQSCADLAEKIDAGIQRFAIVEHPRFGKIYAYETDGLGNYNLMDDANSPSLLAIPYLGYRDKDDEIYRNTRRFILSAENPYYFTGKAASGIGSPHTPKNYIWHISLIMQILTSSSEEEIHSCLSMIARTHAGTNFMHEGFDADDPTKFTREWFAWANTLFAQMMARLTSLI